MSLEKPHTSPYGEGPLPRLHAKGGLVGLSSLKLVESLSMGRDPMASTLFPSIDSSDNFQQNAVRY
jgi:hypothetical protein